MIRILGISAFYHDSAAALIENGRILGAVQEERFSRKKYDNGFPHASIGYLLGDSKLSINDIDYIVFYEKPALKLARICRSFLFHHSFRFSAFIRVINFQLKKFRVKAIIKKELGYGGKVIFVKHHESHAASSFYPSAFRKAAFLTIDGVGEFETLTYGVGDGNKLLFKGNINFPHSLGLLYAAFTYFIGFKVNSGEYKVMGLAPYGIPKYKEKILSELIKLEKDGSFKLNMRYFDFTTGSPIINSNFENLFGRKRRMPELELTQDDMDFARSVQEVIEEVILRMARRIRKETGEKYLCLAGGVALNCVVNGKILKENIFDDIYIQPASGDAGGSLGAALYVWYHVLNNSRAPSSGKKELQNTYFGPAYSEDDIKEFLDYKKIPYTHCAGIEEKVADLISQGKVIGWFNGRMEFGPRALGARSILGDARDHEMQKNMNLKIKFRESFRPFAPAVLEEEAGRWFEIDRPSPFMLLVADVKSDKRKSISNENKNLFGIDKLSVVRSDIPAVTHVDYSARLQTVSKEGNDKFYKLINCFYKKTGCPVVVNTSFNVRGEPIVCTPEDAYRCFMRTEIDHLALENFLIDKKSQEKFIENGDWRQSFALD